MLVQWRACALQLNVFCIIKNSMVPMGVDIISALHIQWLPSLSLIIMLAMVTAASPMSSWQRTITNTMIKITDDDDDGDDDDDD